jgi:hypothetical protein
MRKATQMARKTKQDATPTNLSTPTDPTPNPEESTETKPARRTRRPPSDEITIEPVAKPRRGRTPKAKAEPEAVPEAAPVAAAPAKSRRASAKSATKPEPEVTESAPAAKPTRGRAKAPAPETKEVETTAKAAKATMAPARRTAKTAKAPTSEPSAFLESLGFAGLSWRPKSAGPVPTDADESTTEALAEGDTETESKPSARNDLQRGRNRRSRRNDAPSEEVTQDAAPTDEDTSEEAKPAARTDNREDKERRGRRNRRQEEPKDTDTDAPEASDEEAPARPRARFRERPAPKPAVVAPPEPVVPVREPIAIPLDAPQVVVRDGVPILTKNQKALAPHFFFAAALEPKRLETVKEEIKLAAEHGTHLISLLVELEVSEAMVDDAVSMAAYLLKQVTEVNPQALVQFRVAFVAPKDWEKNYKNARFIGEDGMLADPSVSDDAFWNDAEDCLARFIRKLRKMPFADHVLGIHLERGEWFFPTDGGYDNSISSTEKFRQWLRARYRNDVVTLRASWFDGSADFDTVQIPPMTERRSLEETFVRTDRKSRRWVDYHLFLSDTTHERITNLAYCVKKESEGTYLVGVSYGYTFEWSHPYSGHLSLGKLLRCADVDYIAGPPSHESRLPGALAAFPGPMDSFALNGKLALSEEDYKTPISGREEPDSYNPVIKTPQALENVHWRGAGLTLAHGGGNVWMDTWGNGWLNSPGIWARAEKIQAAQRMRMQAPMTAPDVALLIDERSLAYLADREAFDDLVKQVRESLLRSGLSVGCYLISDLAHRENFPESRLYVFVNAWDVRPEVRSAIKSRLQRDNKVLFWLYAAGLFEAGRESLERAREITGIAIRPQPFASRSGTTLLNTREPLCQALDERKLAEGGTLSPSYFAIPEVGVLLGEYSSTGLPSFVVSPFDEDPDRSKHWLSVFLGEPIVSPALFRELGTIAGAHVWSFDDDVIWARPPFLTIHAKGTGPRTIALPDQWSAYNLVSNEWVTVENHAVRFHALDGHTYSFLVGMRGDIEALLKGANDGDDAVDVQTLRANQPGHANAMDLDVPIMQLGEWVEETWSEDLADDFLLKPSFLEIDRRQEEAIAIQDEMDPDRRRRNNRRNRRNRGGQEEGTRRGREGADRQEAEPDSINVFFRKRD